MRLGFDSMPPLMEPKIVKVHIQFQGGVVDQPIWDLTETGKFTCDSAWETIRKNSTTKVNK